MDALNFQFSIFEQIHFQLAPLSLGPGWFVPILDWCYAIFPESVFMSTYDFYSGLLLVMHVDKLFCVGLRADLVGHVLARLVLVDLVRSVDGRNFCKVF